MGRSAISLQSPLTAQAAAPAQSAAVDHDTGEGLDEDTWALVQVCQYLYSMRFVHPLTNHRHILQTFLLYSPNLGPKISQPLIVHARFETNTALGMTQDNDAE